MIDLAAYVLEPLHQEGACLLSRGQLRGQRAGMVPALLVVAPVGDHPAPASLRRLEHEYAVRAALDPAWAVRPLALVQDQGRPVLVLADPGASRSRASWVARWRCRRGCASPSGSQWRWATCTGGA